MEGGLISVTEAFTLPAQPTSTNGSTQYVPLGGDGFSAPKAAYMVRGARIAGDASAGLATINITMDDRFTSMIQYVTGQIDEAAADSDFSWFISSPFMASVITKGVDLAGNVAFSPNLGHTWNPVPILLPGQQAGLLSVGWPNVDADTFFCDALIYLFDIDVRQKSPIAPLLWARGSSQA